MSVPARSRGLSQERARRSRASRRLLVPVQEYLHNETISSAFLLAAAAVALFWANSPWRSAYFRIMHLPVSFTAGNFSIAQDLTHWINEGLMAIFFFVVALEIKREFVYGQLSEGRKAALPVAAALGGMLLPACIYLGFTWSGPGVRGWGIPMATDIAFGLGVLALVGRRLPPQLRIFLLTSAVVDDIGSILVIAVYYTQEISVAAGGLAVICLAVIVAMRGLGFWAPMLYLLPALVFWAALLKTGIHASVAGVVLGALTPARAQTDRRSFLDVVEKTFPGIRGGFRRLEHEQSEVLLGQAEELIRGTESPLERMERLVHPWVSFLVLPIFALANAGIEFSGDSFVQALSSPVARGILAGLLLGKVFGMVGVAWLATRTGLAALPQGVTWKHLIGTGWIGGIGFTVSLFIANLAFSEERMVTEAKMGILAASLVAAAAGFVWLRLAARAAPVRG